MVHGRHTPPLRSTLAAFATEHSTTCDVELIHLDTVREAMVSGVQGWMVGGMGEGEVVVYALVQQFEVVLALCLRHLAA
jgi:hypothetical protein